MRSFPIKMASVCLMAISLFMYGCGGGGGGSDPEPGGEGTGAENGESTAMQCPEGQMGTYPDCMPAGPTAAERDAEGKALDSAISKAVNNTGAFQDTTDATITGIVTSGMPASNSKFGKSDEAPHSIDGRNVNVYERSNAGPASTDLVVLYNDKAADKPTAYGTVYPNADSSTIEGISSISSGVITFTADTAAFSSKIKGNFFDSIGNSQQGNTVADNAETATIKEHEHKGIFDTVPGKFTCGDGTSTCSASRTAAGVLSLSAGWTFTPDPQEAGAAQYTVPVADADYLRFGFWKNTGKNDKGETTFTVDPLYGGTMPINTSELSPAQGTLYTGTAKYVGKATGKYVRKTFTSDNDPEHYFPGQFTADASLTASFGGGGIAADSQYGVVGKISNFKDGDTAIDNSWTLELQRAGFGSGEDSLHATSGVFSGITEGDKALEGNWEGQFFGSAPQLDADTETDGNQQAFPTGIAGQFDGRFTNGSVLGSFGAAHQDN